MKVYQAGEKWIMGLNGGRFRNINKKSEAIILNKEPSPYKKWTTPTFIEDLKDQNEKWEYEFTLLEFKAEESSLYYFELIFNKTLPGFLEKR